MRLGVFIPAVNAAATIEMAISKIPTDCLPETVMLVVADGCSDGTMECALRASDSQADLTVVANLKRSGYGGVCKFGYAWMRSMGVDIMAILHGDLQYSPTELPKLVRPILENRADVVYGSRLSPNMIAPNGMPVVRKLANRVLGRVMNEHLKLNLSDYHSGYIVSTISAFDGVGILGMMNGHEFTAQLAEGFARSGARVCEVPVLCRYDDHSRSMSHVAGIRYSLFVAWRYLAAKARALRSAQMAMRKGVEGTTGASEVHQ